ncbi:MAG: type II toxin-antitoxin system Phd/YefM family antitoxin [Gemmatimonadota bacterium]
MTSVGAYEAKTRLSELLERVARGERFTITRHGTAIARLVPVDPRHDRPPAEIIEEILRFRKGRQVRLEEIREWVEEGRRHG